MDKLTANKIIVEELNKFYQLAKYQPSVQIWEQFLDTLDELTAIKLSTEYTAETAYSTLWIYKHWYMQNYHKQEVDNLMKMVLMPEVFAYYKKRYETYKE